MRESAKVEVKSYRDLIVWQKGLELTRLIYRITRAFPEDERYGLASQLRRSSVSVPSNIAEGYGRNSTTDYIRFIRMATGSLYEVQTQLEIGFAENMISEADYASSMNLCRELEKMLVTLAKKLGNGKS
jgi:four helix bundle protein